MRRFSAGYLRRSRESLWSDEHPLQELELSDASVGLDVGAGTGAWTSHLAKRVETAIAVDADRSLIAEVDSAIDRIIGDATMLPLRGRSADIVTCQALLINLQTPVAALEEFERVTRDHVLAVEPANGAVSIDSTVKGEGTLAEEFRTRVMAGSDRPMGLDPADLETLFAEVGFDVSEVRQVEHVLHTKPPYSDRALKAAEHQITGSNLTDTREVLLASGLSPDEFEQLRDRWRAIGREVIEQMQSDRYERIERIPITIAHGRLSPDKTEESP